MPRVICLAGPTGSVKSELLVNLSTELSRRGKRVGIILDKSDQVPPGEPASAKGAALWLEGGMLRLKRPLKDEASLDQLVSRYLFGLDMVISGAFSETKTAKIEFCPPGARPKLTGDPGLRAVVGDAGLNVEVPVFAPDDVSGLASFILDKLTPASEPPKVRVLLNGRKIPVNQFVQDIIADTVRGLVASLRGGEGPGRLELYIEE